MGEVVKIQYVILVFFGMDVILELLKKSTQHCLWRMIQIICTINVR